MESSKPHILHVWHVHYYNAPLGKKKKRRKKDTTPETKKKIIILDEINQQFDIGLIWALFSEEWKREAIYISVPLPHLLTTGASAELDP